MNFSDRTIYVSDNLPILRGMDSDTVDLVYLDPPFNSNRTYAAPVGSQAAGASFKDDWHWDDNDETAYGQLADEHPKAHAVVAAALKAHGKSMGSYTLMMVLRLIELKRVLKPSGSVYVHCDPTANSYLRVLMDAVLGRRNFQNEIVWKRHNGHNRTRRWGPIHDTLLFYGGPRYTWNRVLEPFTSEDAERLYGREDDRGRHATGDLTGPGTRTGATGLPWRGIDPGAKGRHWEVPPDRSFPAFFDRPADWSEMTPQARLDELDRQGLIAWSRNGNPSYKRYLLPTSGRPASDLVLDCPPARGDESTGYPTQKPLALMRRIVEASSNPGDVVLDPFCGCATTCVASEALGRRWVGIDLSIKAHELVVKRLRDHHGVFGDVRIENEPPTRTDLPPVEPEPVARTSYKLFKRALYSRQLGACAICEIELPYRLMTVDHILPRAKGGTDAESNLQAVCSHCNSVKGANRTNDETRTRLAELAEAEAQRELGS